MKKEDYSLEQWQGAVWSDAIKQSDVVSGMIEVNEHRGVCQKPNSVCLINKAER